MTTPDKRGRASAANAGPTQMAVISKGEERQYSKDGAPASVTSFQRERIKLRRFAALRVKEITTLALFRRRDSFVVDGNRFASALAFTLSCDRPGQVLAPAKAEDRGKRRPVPWPGLSLETLRRATASAELGEFEDDELLTIISSVERWRHQNGPRLATAKRLGLELALTAVERDACSIRTIEATDESKAEREARLHAAKLIRDREAKRAKRGRVPREVYESTSLSKLKPWEAEGIGRSAWYERQRRTGVSPVISNPEPATHLSGVSTDQLGNVGSSRRVGARAAGGTEFPDPGSEMIERSESTSYGAGSSAARSRGLSASRMVQKGMPMATFDPSETIAALIEAEALLSDISAKSHGTDIERFEKLSASVGMFRLLLEVSVVAQSDDGAETLNIGIDHLAPRLRAANDNRLSILAKRLAA